MSIFKNKYLFSNPEHPEEGAGTILQLSTPYFTGRVIKFNNEDDYASFVTAARPYPIGKVPGYRVAIQFAGALDPLPEDFEQMKAQNIMDEMADYFLNTKISSKPGGYKRYKI